MWIYMCIFTTNFIRFSEAEYEKLPESTCCEMQRTDLSLAVLHLKALGIDNVLRFSFPAPPPAKNLAAAMELLFALGAIDEDGKLTTLGNNMAEFPMHPLYSKMLLTSGSLITFHFLECTAEYSG